MMKSTWWFRSLAVFGLLLLLAACGSGGESNTTSTPESNEENGSDESADGKTYKIGVTQIVEHPSLNAAFEGFKQALADAGLDVEYDEQNAQNDQSANTTIASNLASSGADLIFANSTPSAQAVASATQDIPILFTSVTDPLGAELVASLEEPGGNVTGTIDLHPEVIPNTMTFLKEQLNAEKIGIIYNAGEQNASVQAEKVKEMAEELDVTVVEATVATSADVKQAADSLVGKVDSLYIIKDNTVVSALESVIEVAVAQQLPMMVGELDSTKRGGLAAYGFEYFDLGYETGEMAVEILTGEKEAADLPVQIPKSLTFMVNKETADKVGVEIQEEWEAEIYE